MAARGLGVTLIIGVTIFALGLGPRSFAAFPRPSQEASPVASPAAGPLASPVDTTTNLLATVAAQETATAVSATEQALRGPQETVSAITTQNAEMQVALGALATREAGSARAVANAEATIVGLDLAQIDAQATIASLTTAQSDAQATITVLSTAVADVRATENAVPTATPEPTVTPTPEPTATPEPQAGDVLYETGEEGFQGWPVSQDWKTVDSVLVNDGTIFDYDRWIKAPFAPSNVNNYAVEAEIQLVNAEGTGFGIVARAAENAGYRIGVRVGCCPRAAVIADSGNRFNYGQDIASTEFQPGNEWHTYRVEVQGNTVRLLIDGNVMTEATVNQFLTGGEVGLFSISSQINVRSFRVIAL